MPNWCSNVLAVTGPAKEVKRFVAKAASKAKERQLLSFNSFIPMPEELMDVHEGGTTINGVKFTKWRTVNGHDVGLTAADIADMTERFGAAGWYDWSYANWGTKWDAGEAYLEYDDGERAVFSFDTAWSPICEGLLAEMAAQFPELGFELSFEEPGCCFQGTAFASDGELTSYESHEYTPESDDEDDPVPEAQAGSDDPLEA